MTDFPYERPAKDRPAKDRPAKDRPKMRSVQAIMDAFPDAGDSSICLIIDAKEQRIQRPSGEDEQGNSRQKPFYSGKKKTHTLKNQVAVNPQGRFLSVSESVAGGANHDLTLLRTTKLLSEPPSCWAIWLLARRR